MPCKRTSLSDPVCSLWFPCFIFPLCPSPPSPYPFCICIFYGNKKRPFRSHSKWHTIPLSQEYQIPHTYLPDPTGTKPFYSSADEYKYKFHFHISTGYCVRQLNSNYMLFLYIEFSHRFFQHSRTSTLIQITSGYPAIKERPSEGATFLAALLPFQNPPRKHNGKILPGEDSASPITPALSYFS